MKKEENKPSSMVLECPACGNKKAEMVETVQDIPNFGGVLISSLVCGKCGLKINDVVAAETREPAKYSVKVSNAKDLETKVVKSGSGTVMVPELGVRVEPGPSAEGYISNIEGVLERVEKATKVAINSEDEGEANEKKLARKELRRIQSARKGEIAFTVIVEDPFGNSALLGDKVKEEKLSDEEIARLKKNIEVLEM